MRNFLCVIYYACVAPAKLRIFPDIPRPKRKRLKFTAEKEYERIVCRGFGGERNRRNALRVSAISFATKLATKLATR